MKLLSWFNKIGIIKYHIKRLNSFSEISKARLIVLALFLIIVNLYAPILTSLKGIYLTIFNIKSATLIALFSLASIIIVKFAPYIMKKTKYSILYKLSIIVNSLFLFGGLLYFISPALFVWVDSIIGVIDALIYWMIATTNQNYIHYFEPDDYTSYQNYKMDLVTEVEIVGLILSAILTGFFSIGISIIVLSIIGIVLFLYQISVIKYYEKYDFRYMLNYHRDLRKQKKKLKGEIK